MTEETYVADALLYVIENEGGYVNDPDDPGGETKYGITKRIFPEVDIKNLTKEQAMALYYTHYWIPSNLSAIKIKSVAIKMLDAAVNMGIRTAILCMQRAIRSLNSDVEVEADGILGPITANAINNASYYPLLTAYASELAGYYRWLVCKNPNLFKFLEGWENRAYSLRCLKM